MDPSTTFFEYSEDEHDSEKLESLFKGYLKQNKQVLDNATEEASNEFAFNESYPVDPNFKAVGNPSVKMTIKERK